MSDLLSGGPGPRRPVLRLNIRPDQGGIDAGGKVTILDEYEERRAYLISVVEDLVAPTSERTRWFADYALFHIEMDLRCWAPSWTPDHLMSRGIQAQLVAPWYGGYLVELPLSAREPLLAALRAPTSKRQRQDISAIVGFKPVHEVRGVAEAQAAWDKRRAAREAQPTFIGMLAPHKQRAARTAVVERLRVVLRNQGLLTQLPDLEPPSSSLTMPSHPGDLLRTDGMAAYLSGRANRIVLPAASLNDLLAGSASGTIVRWDPVAPLAPRAPGIGPEPDPILEFGAQVPIVGVIDGGMTSERYRPAVAWQAPPFLPNPDDLDTEHGNSVAGLVVDGHAWNNRLDLPSLFCRLGIVPAVPNEDYDGPWDPIKLLNYIDRVVGEHPDTKVWNISANMEYACDSDRVSEFGDALNILARRRGVLFVISSGNIGDDDSEIIAPPADSDAALTVGGRTADSFGQVGEACPVSRTGRGPEDMLKPELSWFSTQRLAVDGFGQASSWAAPLVSRLAAHTWANLRAPTPDLVKALLINAADHTEYRKTTGFGSPVLPALPWQSTPDKVTFAWTAELDEKKIYTWEGIRIPPSLIQPGGKFRGRVRLVAILEPKTQMLGTNYFSTRLQTSVRYVDQNGKWERYVGSVATETAELVARETDNKWQPVRCNVRTSKTLSIGSGEMQVQARLFGRDRYCHSDGSDTYKGTVTFVISIESIDRQQTIHDEFVQLMGNLVEVAVETPITVAGT